MTFWKFIAAILVPAALLSAAEPTPDVQFSGVLVGPDTTRVHLTKTSTGFSAWVPVGQTFVDYQISRYDEKSETLVLTRNGGSTHVRLNPPRVRQAPLLPVTAQQRAAISNNLRQISAAFERYARETGKTHATIADLLASGKYIRPITSVAGEDYGSLTLVPGNIPLTVTTSNGTVVTYEPPQPNVNITVTATAAAPTPAMPATPQNPPAQVVVDPATSVDSPAPITNAIATTPPPISAMSTNPPTGTTQATTTTTTVPVPAGTTPAAAVTPTSGR